MIRRSGLTLVKSIRNATREPRHLQVEPIRSHPVVSLGKQNDIKLFHSRLIIPGTAHSHFPQDLHNLHKHKDGLCFVCNRNASTTDTKIDSELEDESGASPENGKEAVLKEVRDPEKDRSKVIPVETSMRYLKSDGK